jgi:hypothetical protein
MKDFIINRMTASSFVSGDADFWHKAHLPMMPLPKVLMFTALFVESGFAFAVQGKNII